MGKADPYDFFSLDPFEFFHFGGIICLCGKWFGGFSGCSNGEIKKFKENWTEMGMNIKLFSALGIKQ